MTIEDVYNHGTMERDIVDAQCRWEKRMEKRSEEQERRRSTRKRSKRRVRS